MFKVNVEAIEEHSNPDEIKKGKILYNRDFFKTKDISIIRNSNNTEKMTYKIEWTEGFYSYFTNSAEIEVDIHDNVISTKTFCTCNNRVKTCKHLVAFAYTVRDYNLELKNKMGEKGYKDYEEQLLKKFEEAKLAELERVRQEQVKAEKRFFNTLLSEYNYLTSPNKLNDKVELYPVYNDYEATLSLKIGNKSKYIIKDIRNFLGSVKKKENVSYGKKLEFVHDINNFDDKSKKLLEILLSRVTYNSSYAYGNGLGSEMYRNLKVNKFLLEDILEIYKNNYIDFGRNWDVKTVFVSSDIYEPTIYVDDEKIVLKDLKDFHLILCEKRNFIEFNNVIYEMAEIKDELLPIYNKLVERKVISIKDSLKPFLKEIYPVIHNHIEIEDSFKEKYPLLDLRVDSYFDLDEGVLNHSAKYFIGDKESTIDKINNGNYTASRLALYEKYINSLGFIEGKTDDLDNISMFIKTDLNYLKSFGDIYLSENLKSMQIKKVSKINVSLKYDVDMFSVCFVDLGFSDEELYNIINSFKKKKRFVRLKGDVIVEIDEKQMEAMVEVIDDFGLDTKKLSKEQEKPLYTVAKVFNKQDNAKISYNYNKQLLEVIKRIQRYKENDYEVPDSFKKILRAYQVDAFKWLKTLTDVKMGGILADDMGLGKTIEIISFIVSDEVEKPSLIIAPTSLIYNWSNEIVKWGSEVEHVVVNGNTSIRKEIVDAIEPNKKVLYITSYDTFKNDIDLYKDVEFRFAILDEAQFIKNYYTQKAQAVKEAKSEVRFVLTGTPIENSLLDLWSIFDFLLPDYLSNHHNFKAKYEKAITNENDHELLSGLVKKITPFVLRRTKKNVLKDLPDKIENVVYVSMDEDQRKVYEAYLLSTRSELENGKSKFDMLARLTRLRQICVDPKLFLDSYKGSSAKVEMAIDTIFQSISNDHRVLLFSSFTTLFPTLEEELNKRNIKFFKLTGATPALERLEMANEFNNNEDIKVFLISLKAGGTGLNLVGADTIIHFDPWWNVSVENQATDRSHRIGQEKVVQVIKLVCENSIEQKVIELQNLKKDLADKVISDDESYLKNLKEDDLKYLLS